MLLKSGGTPPHSKTHAHNCALPQKQGTRELPREFPLHYLLTFNSCNLFNLLPYGVGRGCGVGRGLGVTLGVAVGVTEGVGVGVPGVGVGVTEGVGVGVGVGVGPHGTIS
jgi:hypothetical protein